MSESKRVEWFERDPVGGTLYVAPKTTPEPRPEVKSKLIVVCGSLSDESRLVAASVPERLAGHCVVTPHREPWITPAEHAAEWRRWIDRADEVLAVRKPDGSIGDAVTAEVAYAREVGCPVRWWPEEESRG